MKIYCITNSINGKSYVGQTVQSIEARWKQHCTRNGLRLIGAAIRTYGAAAFTIEQVTEADSQKELNLLEKFWIVRMNTIAPNGYNLSDGGGSGGKMSEDTRRLMRAKATRPERIALAMEQLQNVKSRARAQESRNKNFAAGKGKKTGPNKNGVGEPRATMQAHWDNPEWKAMMLEKRHANEAARKASIAITNALPETKLRRSLAAAQWQAKRKREKMKHRCFACGVGPALPLLEYVPRSPVPEKSSALDNLLELFKRYTEADWEAGPVQLMAEA